MGEGFRRARAAAFQQQRNRQYQALLNATLLTLSRTTTTRFGLSARLANANANLAVGTVCMIAMTRDGGQYELIHGNRVIGALSPEATLLIHEIEELAPALSGVIPCHVAQENRFGSVLLELEPANEDEADE